MTRKKAPRVASADAATTLRQVTIQVDRMFDQEIRWPATERPEAPVTRGTGRKQSRPTMSRRQPLTAPVK
jgi:hypothetical protein